MSRYLKSFANRRTLGQVIRVGVIGGFNTLVYFIILNVLFGRMALVAAVTIAFALATAMSYVLNRRWTFQIADGSVGSARESWAFYLVNLVAWGVTVVVVGGAERMWGELTQPQANLAAIVATAIILLPKFAAYRDVVFKRSLEAQASHSRGVILPGGPAPSPAD